jgi:hypothetical protein
MEGDLYVEVLGEELWKVSNLSTKIIMTLSINKIMTLSTVPNGPNNGFKTMSI